MSGRDVKDVNADLMVNYAYAYMALRFMNRGFELKPQVKGGR